MKVNSLFLTGILMFCKTVNLIAQIGLPFFVISNNLILKTLTERKNNHIKPLQIPAKIFFIQNSLIS